MDYLLYTIFHWNMNSASVNMDTVATIYFYTILNSLMSVNFGLDWLKCDTFFLLYKCWCEYFATLNPGSISMRDWHIHLTIVGSTKFVSKFCPMTKSICGWFYQLPRNELKEFSFKLIEGKHFFFTITRLICLFLEKKYVLMLWHETLSIVLRFFVDYS